MATANGEQPDAESQNMSVAARSSTTAEDLPDASFTGQQETFLLAQCQKETRLINTLLEQ